VVGLDDIANVVNKLTYISYFSTGLMIFLKELYFLLSVDNQSQKHLQTFTNVYIRL